VIAARAVAAPQAAPRPDEMWARMHPSAVKITRANFDMLYYIYNYINF